MGVGHSGAEVLEAGIPGAAEELLLLGQSGLIGTHKSHKSKAWGWQRGVRLAQREKRDMWSNPEPPLLSPCSLAQEPPPPPCSLGGGEKYPSHPNSSILHPQVCAPTPSHAPVPASKHPSIQASKGVLTVAIVHICEREIIKQRACIHRCPVRSTMCRLICKKKIGYFSPNGTKKIRKVAQKEQILGVS